MNNIIATPSRTKEILEKYDLYAKKNYGQNFLIESSIVDKIAKNAMTDRPCTVFEIGPGIGALTQFLSHYAKHVVAFEIDERLLPVLADSLSECKNVEIVHTDFLAIDLKAYVNQYAKAGEDVVIAANLPYYITTPILFKIFESEADIAQITVMMQKEVADRFSAVVNTKDYNALSVITQYRCDVKVVMKISKHVFSPKPNVDSAVVRFRFKKQARIANESAFFALVKACFKQRRKTILNNYGEYCKDKELAKQNLAKAHIDERARAESLSLDMFIKLFEVHDENRSECEN
ncbi:MAG: 16S rRNA (adenine(1518)-N(6)/adenine(1519)-N(6))-dimethyltransferase RsmA [Erysipelotrichia bacterium]|nr:16S rRNA (adenine(1518)-N(6)/adenine(1519)-N(6))-dimethyltransferase RsmA [Erysipelotrichia bacterium]NCC55443.1 16S rRNA (adenine(1518)-N(6)/adenine(1519)-N(6))-dimethyltransferase RsmA [Erysipelotrichia bacterium]